MNMTCWCRRLAQCRYRQDSRPQPASAIWPAARRFHHDHGLVGVSGRVVALQWVRLPTFLFLPIKTQADAGLLGFSFLSSRRSILPTLLFGSSDLNSTCFGTLYGVNCVPAKLIMSWAVRCGSTRTTNILTASVDFASGMPIAAHSRTPGWLAITSSTSFG